MIFPIDGRNRRYRYYGSPEKVNYKMPVIISIAVLLAMPIISFIYLMCQ